MVAFTSAITSSNRLEVVKLNRSISIFLIISNLFARNHAVIKLHKQDQFCFARAFSIALFNSAKTPS
jgi:hypothetical protein